MGNKFFNDVFLEKSYFYLTCLVSATLLFPMLINNIAIMLLLLTWLFLFITKKQRGVKFNLVQYAFSFLFICAVLSLVYSKDIWATYKSTEKILSFAVFPVIYSLNKLTKKQVRTVLVIFAATTIGAVFLALIIALKRVFENGSIYKFNPNNLVIENLLKYHKLSENINFHPTYLSIYVVFTIVILLFIYQNHREEYRLNNATYLGLGVFLLTVLYLLNSFAVMTAFVIILLTLTLFFNRKKKYGYVFTFFAIIGMVSIFYSKSRKNIEVDRILKFNFEDSIRSKNWNSVNSRLAKWDCAFEVARENLPFGVGKGASKKFLLKKYYEKNFLLGIKRKFSSHNLYLTYLMDLGYLGLFSILGLIFIIFLMAIRHKSLLLVSLAILLIITSITEEVLELNKGIVFFSFFSVLISTRKK